MGFLDSLAGQVLGGGQGSDLLSQVVGLINNQPGGLGGLVQSFQQKGLGDIVSSWVGTGQNQPISGDQIQSALGSDTVEDLAGKVGLPAADVASQLTGLLPGLVDHLTPNGRLPEGVQSIGMDLLKGFLSRGAGG